MNFFVETDGEVDVKLEEFAGELLTKDDDGNWTSTSTV